MTGHVGFDCAASLDHSCRPDRPAAAADMLVRLSKAPVVSIVSIRGRATGVGSELSRQAVDCRHQEAGGRGQPATERSHRRRMGRFHRLGTTAGGTGTDQAVDGVGFAEESGCREAPGSLHRHVG